MRLNERIAYTCINCCEFYADGLGTHRCHLDNKEASRYHVCDAWCAKL